MQGKPALIIECDGHDSDSLLSAMQNIVSQVKPSDSIIATSESQRRQIWEQRKAMSIHLKSRRKHKVSEDIVVPRSKILEFADKFALIGQKHGVETALFGHAGDGNLHAQLLFDEDLDVSKILRDLFTLTIKLGGTISGEHGIGLQKKKYLSLEQNLGLIELQKSVKRLFDPENFLNPDKIFN
jgi:glycolate oxidase